MHLPAACPWPNAVKRICVAWSLCAKGSGTSHDKILAGILKSNKRGGGGGGGGGANEFSRMSFFRMSFVSGEFVFG